MSDVHACFPHISLEGGHPLSHLLDVPHTNPNRAIILLFRTVIIAAFYDGLKGCPDAVAWLTQASADLEEVCDYSDLQPCWVRKTAKQIMAGRLTLPPYRIWRYLWADLQQKNA